MLWLFILCAALIIAVILLMVKIILMRRAAAEIQRDFSDKLENDTNTLITISSRDKAMRGLANSINQQLRILRKERRRFLQGDKELKNAVTNISHDLRTPLTAICGYLDLLDGVEKNETAERYLSVIKNRTEILKQLTEELFRYSVITATEADESEEILTVNSVLEESIAAFYAALREKNITPEIHMTEKKVLRKLNKASLSRIFSNLLSNVIKYSDGDLTITLTDTGKIIFSNTASGLNEVQTGKLFDRFYTVEDGRKSTGLGLSIVKILTEKMGGEISAQYVDQKLHICIFFPETE